MKYNYKGEFRDTFDRKYEVFLEDTKQPHTYKELTLSTSPVTITQNSEGLFAPIKPLSCTIRIVTPEIISDLYSENNKAIRMMVREHGAHITMFDGYVTPFIYNQTYAHALDELEIEGVSRLSVLKDIDYVTLGDKPQMLSFKDIICHILRVGAGYRDDEINFRYYKTFETEDDRILRLSDLSISEANFFDDDDERTPWKMYDVLSEIFKYLGVSLVEHDLYLYLVDYQHISTFTDNDVYCFNENDNFEDVSATDIIREDEIPVVNVIGYDQYASNDANISYDDIYDKIEITANTYNIEELCPSIEELKNSNNISGYPVKQTWTRTEYKRNGKVKSKNTLCYEYSTLRILKDITNWKHRYYKMSNGTELSNYYDANSQSVYNKSVWPRINTRCAVIEKYAYQDADDPTPATMDWSTYIAFFCLDDTTNAGGTSNKFKYSAIKDKLEVPVLEYTSTEPLRYSPKTGTSYITFKGDLFYQTNTSGNPNLNIVNTTDKWYTYTPVDQSSQHDSYKYTISETWKESGFLYWGKTTVTRTMGTRSKSDSSYGKGWPMLQAKLQIGDKYWNGTTWTTTDSTFTINYNNSPKDGAEETFKVLEWQSVAPNYNYEASLPGDCWAIPITKSDNVSGILKFSLYTPSQMGPVLDTWNYAVSWMVLFPVIFMKDFELNYVYVDNTAWFLADEKEETDIVYTNTTDTQVNREHDGIECKINSYLDNVPISRSFVICAGNKFLGKVTNRSTGNKNVMEYQLVEKYLNHYINKKLVYETTLYYWGEGSRWWYSYVEPHTRNEFIFNKEDIATFNYENNTPRPFVVDSYSFDLVTNTVKAKFIEW